MSIAKKSLMTSLIASALTIAIAAPSMAAPCRDDKSLAKRVFSGFVKACEGAGENNLGLCAKSNKILDALKQVKESLNNIGITVGNNWLTVGTVETGRFSAQGSPMFTTDKPVDKDSLNVRVVKTGGKGGVNAVICAIDDKSVTRLDEISIDNGSREEEGKTVTVNGIKGKILQVQLNGVGTVLQTTAFKLNVR